MQMHFRPYQDSRHQRDISNIFTSRFLTNRRDSRDRTTSVTTLLLTVMFIRGISHSFPYRFARKRKNRVSGTAITGLDTAVKYRSDGTGHNVSTSKSSATGYSAHRTVKFVINPLGTAPPFGLSNTPPHCILRGGQ